MWGAWWRPFRADTSWPGARWSAWLICRRIRIIVGTRMPYGMLVLNAFEQAGLPCNMCADVPWSQLACALVNAGVGIAVVDEFTVMQNTMPDVVIVPLQERIPLNISAVYASNRNLRASRSSSSRSCAACWKRPFQGQIRDWIRVSP